MPLGGYRHNQGSANSAIRFESVRRGGQRTRAAFARTRRQTPVLRSGKAARLSRCAELRTFRARTARGIEPGRSRRIARHL